MQVRNPRYGSCTVVEAINQRIGSYLALKTLLSLLLGVISYGVMALYGLEFAGFFAVLTGFLNFVPYVGSVLGVVAPVLLAVVQFQDPVQILTLLLALTAVQFVIGNFLDPYVMGNSLNLSPFAILLSLAVWSELWGIPAPSWPCRSPPSWRSCSRNEHRRFKAPPDSTPRAGSVPKPPL